ncbi:FixH family protein [Psychromonas sp. MME2]|uniref:FixH family protein n=1 Tax=unclassified Psychromonas TaxID=2614957 RepID=UPI00339CE22E
MQKMNKIWFKQFWPWFLILLPMAAVVGGISTLIIANNNKPNMVADDYYIKGKAINSDLSQLKNAQRLNIKAEIQQVNDQIVISLGGVKDNSSIYFSLFHSTLADQDITTLLTADAQGRYHFDTGSELKGKWLLRIEPFDKSWRLQQTVQLPATTINL